MFRRPASRAASGSGSGSEDPAADDPHGWRPQSYGSGRVSSVRNPIIEPKWGGLRVLVHVDGDDVQIRDEDAVDCTEEFADVADAIRRAAQADEMILDGYITVHATQSSTAAVGLVEVRQGEVAAQFFLGARVATVIGGRKHRLDPDRPLAFVAIDMLSVEGTSLLDVPLLERKRHLGSALAEDETVRVTPFIQPPLSTFGQSWEALGFEELAYKAANSRYLPGRTNPDWVTAVLPKR